MRKQRIYLWSGFILCLIAQLIVMGTLGSKFFDETDTADKVEKVLLFLPCAAFGLAADVQIIVSTNSYKPVGFSGLPFKGARYILLAIGILSLLVSIAIIVFSFLVFGGISHDPHFRRLIFVAFMIKALTWSPFLALELYDTLFEQIYHDVQFQLNVIRPYTSRSASPNQQRQGKTSARNSKNLSTIKETNQQTLLEESSEAYDDQDDT